MFTIMDDLDYPDLSYLIGLWRQYGPDVKPKIRGPIPQIDVPNPWRDVMKIDAYHATRLVHHGLLVRRPNKGDRLSARSDDAALLTGLGARMLELIRDPESDSKVPAT